MQFSTEFTDNRNSKTAFYSGVLRSTTYNNKLFCLFFSHSISAVLFLTHVPQLFNFHPFLSLSFFLRKKNFKKQNKTKIPRTKLLLSRFLTQIPASWPSKSYSYLSELPILTWEPSLSFQKHQAPFSTKLQPTLPLFLMRLRTKPSNYPSHISSVTCVLPWASHSLSMLSPTDHYCFSVFVKISLLPPSSTSSHPTDSQVRHQTHPVWAIPLLTVHRTWTSPNLISHKLTAQSFFSFLSQSPIWNSTFTSLPKSLSSTSSGPLLLLPNLFPWD